MEGSIGSDDTMTRNDDADTVLAVCKSDRTGTAGIIESSRELAVRDGLTERDVDERIPYFALPIRSGAIERDMKLGELASEVSIEFGFKLIEVGMIALGHLCIKRSFELGLFTPGTLGRPHLEQADPLIRRRGSKRAERGLDDAADQKHAYSITARHTECIPSGGLYPKGEV